VGKTIFWFVALSWDRSENMKLRGLYFEVVDEGLVTSVGLYGHANSEGEDDIVCEDIKAIINP